MKKYQKCAAAVLCVIGMGIYGLLCFTEDKTPGWSDPVSIREFASHLSIVIHNKDIWVASEEWAEIHIHHSHDGKNWSYYNRLENQPSSVREMCPQWLHRPNGDIWLVWVFTDTYGTGEFNYAKLGENKKLTCREKIDVCNSSCQHLLIYGLTSYPPPPASAVLEIRYPSGKWMGIDVTRDVTGSGEWIIDDPEQLLPERISLGGAPFPTLFCDSTGTVWAVDHKNGEGYARKTRDGTTWSAPVHIPVGEDCQIFQRENGEYVSFYIEDDDVFMVLSPDGYQWSEPVRAATIPEAGELAVVESEGVLWAAYSGYKGLRKVIQFMWYSDEQYQKDVVRLQHYRILNGIEAFVFTILLGAGWILVRKIPYYNSLNQYVHEKWSRMETRSKIKVIGLLVGWLVYSIYLLYLLSYLP